MLLHSLSNYRFSNELSGTAQAGIADFAWSKLIFHKDSQCHHSFSFLSFRFKSLKFISIISITPKIKYWKCFFRYRMSLYSPGCNGTYDVDQAILELAISMKLAPNSLIQLTLPLSAGNKSFTSIYSKEGVFSSYKSINCQRVRE